MITKERMKEALDLAVFRGATYISEDVYEALQAAIDREDGPAKEGLRRTLQSLELSREKGLPACPDTGWPLFFIKLGNEAVLEGGVLALQELGRQAIREATLKGTLRKTMKHPITGYDPGDNVSEHTPYFTIQYVPGNEIEITYAAKGGGSEVFGGTRQAKGFGKVTKLIGLVYNGVTGFFSDVLSYVRLMALMLSGSVIASVFNTLGATFGNVILFVIVAMIGNALNLALNLLGCYVHDMRLQCLEFFNRFYKEGGRPYRPLSIDTNYVDVIKEEH